MAEELKERLISLINKSEEFEGRAKKLMQVKLDDAISKIDRNDIVYNSDFRNYISENVKSNDALKNRVDEIIKSILDTPDDGTYNSLKNTVISIINDEIMDTVKEAIEEEVLKKLKW